MIDAPALLPKAPELARHETISNIRELLEQLKEARGCASYIKFKNTYSNVAYFVVTPLGSDLDLACSRLSVEACN